MRIDLYYDFNDDYFDNKEQIRIIENNFKYSVNLKEDELKMSIIDIYNYYKEEAFKEAAFKYLSDYGKFMSQSL